MKSVVGLWIDHSQTSVVMISADGEKTEHIMSDIEKHVRFAGGGRSDGPGTSLEEDQQDRHFDNQLGRYYDKVIAVIREADAILIFGPGEAKRELQQRLERDGLSGRIMGVETADKMTENQIVARVRRYFAETRDRK